ncbi:hypothetical protein Asp14428_56190 [Actinoplanes sp. NBRC 14428]|nr:hypothetical protein Asp14428_56190 [Actinoplanes sp. NBRC 14428]
MLIGRSDIYANHGIIVIGAESSVDSDMVLEGAAAALPSHILVRTRGQAGLTRVQLWSGVAPRVGIEIISAELELSSQYLYVHDLENVSTHYFAMGKVGALPLTILVDDPNSAARVDVVVGGDLAERGLTEVSGYPLFPILVAAGVEVGVADELGMILSGHDMPRARLAAAIKLVAAAPALRPAIRDSRIDRMVEWSRWLTISSSLDRAKDFGKLIDLGIAGLRIPVVDADVMELAQRALSEIESAR